MPQTINPDNNKLKWAYRLYADLEWSINEKVIMNYNIMPINYHSMYG